MTKPASPSSPARLKKVPTGICGFDAITRPLAKLRRTAWQAPAKGAAEHYRLQLYITGTSPRSTEAVNNLHVLCEEQLAGRYDLEVIDLYQEPARAALAQIVASPTLVKLLPKPLMRMVGNLANREQLMIKLHLTRDPFPVPSSP